MTDTPEFEGQRANYRRVARWALLGVVSSGAAWGVAVATDGSDDVLFFAPGTAFGLIIGLTLFGLGYARIWQAALFVPISVVAWYAGLQTGIEYGYEWVSELHLEYDSLSFFVIGVIGGTVWAVVQTIGVVLFPFARRLWLLLALVALGAVVAGLLLAATINDITGNMWVLILWTGWYAVYAAILSTALPPVDWTRAPLARLRGGTGRV